MSTKKAIRPCPICNGNQVEILHNQEFTLLEGSNLPKNYDLVSCNKCGFVYADTKAKQSDYDKYYSELSKYEDDKTGTGGGGSNLDTKRMEKTTNDLIRVIKNREASILDIGCANGGILALLKEAGFSKLTGLDPSHICVEKIKEKKIESILGGLFNIPETLKKRKFDCIILSHVMEHVRDLSLAMENIVSLLAQNGIVYIEVPNAEEYCENFIVPYYYFDCEHINHFDLNSLKNLALNHSLSFKNSVKKMMQVSDSAVYPAIGVFLQKKGENSDKIIPSNVKKSIMKYIRLSKKNDDKKIINDFFKSKEKVIVWGAGQFTQRLLKNTKLNKCNIVSFVDNDSVKQKQKINNIQIIDPSRLKDFSYSILICSALHSQEILKEIRSRRLNNKVYLLSEIK